MSMAVVSIAAICTPEVSKGLVLGQVCLVLGPVKDKPSSNRYPMTPASDQNLIPVLKE